MNKSIRIFAMQRFIGLVVLGLVFAGASLAQTPARGTRVVLKGYDPVAYFTDSKARKGLEDISFDFDEARYLFSSAKNRDVFSKNPDQYMPQFPGFCTGGLANGMKAEANPEIFMIVNGKLYTFASQRAKDAVQADPTSIARAEKNWREKK